MTDIDRRRVSAGIPGSQGIRTFIFIDMMLFAAVFLAFSSERHRLPAVFAESQQHLNGWFGLANTIVLLSSSWAMVAAVRAGRAGLWQRSSRLLFLVCGFGTLFCTLKVFEYGHKFEAGLGPLTNSFYALYFFMTGLHLLHLVGAMIFIVALARRFGNGMPADEWVTQLENAGLFWHFVDLAWLYIFPMLYLVELR